MSFSPDGRFLVFDQKDGQSGDDAFVLALDGSGTPQPIVRSRFDEGSAKVSPDGRWIACSSTESGRPEIYVQPFQGTGAKIQLSNAGGTDPVWRKMGGELFYRGFQGEMMAVALSTGGSELRAGAPKLLWKGGYSSGTGASCGMPGPTSSNYDVTADGQRFLMVKDATGPPGDRVVVVLNFAEEVRAKQSAVAAAGAGRGN